MTKPRILVVDDDPSLCRLLKMTIEKSGRFEVRSENLACSVLRAAREFKPDMILLDVDMPGRDGGETAIALRADPDFANVPILFLTALVSEHEAGIRAVVRGGMRFLAKPVNPQALLHEIRSTLNETICVS